MPIFLLPELAAVLHRAGRTLKPMSRLVLIEEQLLRRARGAFLVHWFGTGVPERQLSLHVAIANEAALRARYLEVQRSMDEPLPGLNLLGPLAGIAGLLAGIAVSPTGVVLIATELSALSDLLVGMMDSGVFTVIWHGLVRWLTPVLGPAAGLLAAVAGLAWTVAAALGGDRTSRAAVRILGETALLLDALIRFWDVLNGPRENVKNPLLRKILDLMDRVTGVGVQVIGFAALVITRVARLLPHLMGEFRALVALAGSAWSALDDIMDGFTDRLKEPFLRKPDPMDFLGLVLDTFTALPGRMAEAVTKLIESVADDLAAALLRVSTAVTAFMTGLTVRIADAFGHTAVGMLLERVNRLLEIFPAVKEAFAAAAKDKKKEKEEEGMGWAGRAALYAVTGGLTGSLNDLIASFDGIAFPGFPGLPDLALPAVPDLPDWGKIADRVGRPAPLDRADLDARLKKEASDALAERKVPPGLLKDPASAFALERAALRASRPPPVLRLDDERLRDLVYVAVGRVLPAALRIHAPAVREALDALDETVYGQTDVPLQHPMLELKDNGALRPVVKVLEVRALGGSGFAPDVRAFRDLLVGALNERKYLVTRPG